MSTAWILVLAVGAATVALKAAGPVLLGTRSLPAPATAIVGLLAPALLAALVVVQTLADGAALRVDARLAGVAAAALALALRAPLLAVLASAAAVAAGARAAGIG
jgi:branched-subunit amino acid transport protein